MVEFLRLESFGGVPSIDHSFRQELESGTIIEGRKMFFIQQALSEYLQGVSDIRVV